MNYYFPTSLSEALRIRTLPGVSVVCGGTDCYASGKAFDEGSAWLDISRIDALKGILVSDGWVRIGAATPWSHLANGKNKSVPLSLMQAARSIGSPQIQHQATIGGNICNAAPAADGIPPLLALDALLELSSANGMREISLADFLLGRNLTTLRHDELLTHVKFRALDENAKTSFYKFGNRRGVTISSVSAAVTLRFSGSGVVEQASIAVGAASATPRRTSALERSLIGVGIDQLHDAVPNDFYVDELTPIDDIRASALFRRRLANLAIRRACTALSKEDC